MTTSACVKAIFLLPGHGRASPPQNRIETEGTQDAGIIGSDFQKQAEAKTPLGRIGQPQDIASVAAFLASEDSGWLSGQTVYASGGYTG